MELEEARTRVVARVGELADVLIGASHQIHARPELCFEEHFAHGLLTSILEGEGLAVTRGAYDLATAFDARAGSAGPEVAVCCEYDALPGVGHACGHNIIAAAGLGAGLAAASLAEEAGGRVRILGTPAEEGGGGKVFMADRGAFAGLDAALMVHPADRDLARMDAIAVRRLQATYEGEAAHAAAFPHQGRNALDAAVLGYVNVAALRQHILADERIHGIFTRTGDQPNIVPDHTEALWYVRSRTVEGTGALGERVLACLRAGADAAGCTLRVDWLEPVYADMRDNEALVEAYRANAAALGRTVLDPGVEGRVVGSTDMGNVSHLVPAIHPTIAVAPPGVAIHSHEFAAWAVAPEGDQAVLDGAKALALTIVDLWLQPSLLDDAHRHFDAT